MCPTRELALQVTSDLRAAAAGMGVTVMTVYGGVGYEPQLDQLKRGVDIVVGTPGRLLDLKNRRDLDLTGVGVLVLDEADEMLDLGFLPDVEKLIGAVPRIRQTMLFSATMPSAIMALARAHLTQPIHIRAELEDEAVMVPETVQHAYQTHDLDKPAIIGKLLESPAANRVMVFCTTKREVQRLADDLADRGFRVTSLHGDLSQIIREKSLTKFRDGKVQAIVCTDVAARGLDVDCVTHVINYHCPDDDKTYIHRVGRTGRAGRTGIAITFIDWADLPRWHMINKALDLDLWPPLEAYSTTPELLAQLEIPDTATGRVAASAPARAEEPAPDKEKPERKSGRRRRRSNGVVVHDKVEQPAEPEAARTEPGRPRRRNRHRRKPSA